jgi:hypothetical protein
VPGVRVRAVDGDVHAPAVTVSASPVCPSNVGDGGVPFDPPSAWDGGCTTNDAIADVECDGGPCLAMVGAMAPIDNECMPTQVVVPQIVTWGSAAFGCAGETNKGTCKAPGHLCVPSPPPVSDGFSICVSRQGDETIIECPAGYPKQSVYYFGGEDDRGCSECKCAPPQNDACASLVSFYSDDTCTMQVGSVTALSSEPVCVSIPSGAPLGSKQAGPPTYAPGTCQASGGEQTGSIQLLLPYTFCCEQ